MAFCGNCFLSFVNSILLLLSLPFLFAGWIVKSASDSPCDPIVYKPLIIVGVFLFVLSLFGILGACCRIKCFLLIYLKLILILIVILAFILIFGASNIKGDHGEQVGGMDFKEYRLQDFSSWLRDNMVSDDHWADVKACMQAHDACEKLQVVRAVVDAMNDMKQTKLSSIEAGCCIPPPDCGFTYINGTWQVPDNGLASRDPDCKIWNNERDGLCYNCSTCKASYLAQFMKYWKKLTIVNIVLLSFLTVIFLFGCCALI